MDNLSNIDIKTTFDAWFDITIKVLQKKIAILKIGISRSLFNSLQKSSSEVNQASIKGTLSYNYYGKFVDMGVGSGVSRGNPGEVSTRRKRKEWYSKLFYSQVMRLREIYQEKYGKEVAHGLVSMIEASQDLKYNAYKK